MADSSQEIDLEQYLWLVVVGIILAFVFAFAVGANDVANSFASTVASKSLTLKGAVIVASIFEFLGAFLLGAEVTTTIRSKIFDVNEYDDQPDILILGLTISILTATFTLLTATFLALPVSTTHTAVGSLMGFSAAAKGFDSIEMNTFRLIVVSWIVSPIIAGFGAYCFFSAVRFGVLHRRDAFERAYATFPIVLIIGLAINLFYIIYKGFHNLQWADEIPLLTAGGLAFAVGASGAIAWIYPFGPIVKARIELRRKQINEKRALEEREEFERTDPKGSGLHPEDESIEIEFNRTEDDERPSDMPANIYCNAPLQTENMPDEKNDLLTTLKDLWTRFGNNTFNQNIQVQAFDEELRARQLWEVQELFDDDAEQLFTYVQVFTACLNSFAHGANDVANAIAPVSALLLLYQDGEISVKAPVQKWILFYGGLGISLGCLIFGYRVMKSLGYKITPLSPSRGASAELASSLFVVSSSFLSIPVSSTQSITGAITGVGLASGFESVNWWFFAKVCCGWIFVFLASIVNSAMIFSLFAFTPSLV